MPTTWVKLPFIINTWRGSKYIKQIKITKLRCRHSGHQTDTSMKEFNFEKDFKWSQQAFWKRLITFRKFSLQKPLNFFLKTVIIKITIKIIIIIIIKHGLEDIQNMERIPQGLR